MNKKILLFCLPALAVAILPSCKKKNSNALKVWCPQSAEYRAVFEQAINAYLEENPGEQIVLEGNSIDDPTSLRTKINDSRSCPDIAICDHVYVAPLAANGLLADLTDMDAGTIKSKVPDGIYQACLYNNRLYSTPYTANTIVLWGNKGLLENAGITSMPTTFDQLLDDLDLLSDANCKAPLLMPVRTKAYSSLIATSYIAKRGGKICSDDFRTMTLDDEKTIQAFRDWFLISTHLGNQSYRTSYQEDAFYSRGDAAFIEMGSWNISKVTLKEGLEVLYSPVVTHDDEIPNYSGLGLYSFVVPKKSAKVSRAFKLAQFLSTNLDFQLNYAKVEKLLPVTNEALQDEYFTEDPILSVYANQLQTVVARPGHPCWEQISSYIDDLVYTIMNECSTIDQVDYAVSETNWDLQEIVSQYFWGM